MLTSKTFVKKTKKGSVVKIVREHYLRDDIWCGSAICDVCPETNPRLTKTPENVSELCSTPHYIILDTNIVLHQFDVLQEPVFKNVIILQTVLQELRKRHPASYSKLKDLLSNSDRHFYTFTNEHHKETYVERNPGETSNDHNDRTIRVATKWYNIHLSESSSDIKVILLTDDHANMDKALKEGLLAYTFTDYVKSMKNNGSLLEKMAGSPHDNPIVEPGKTNKRFFPDHLSLTQLQAGIKSGKYKQGKYQTSRENYLEGYIFVENEDMNTVLIQGLVNINRAVHDDVVAVEVFQKDQWTAPSALVLEDETVNPDEEIVEADLTETKAVSDEERKPTGKVVGIIKRNWRSYCGMLLPAHCKEFTRFLFVPSERRIPKIRIQTRQAESLMGQRIIVSIDSWPQDSRYPHGHYVRSLGKIGEKETENEVLLLEHDVPHLPFSQGVLACLPSMPWSISSEQEKVRQDLRDLVICSVDPPGCTDIDDALHCQLLPNGPNGQISFQVGVHIADVSHFIRPGTAIDKEAAERGTTVYLVDQRIDMVPELLSSNLCSLRGNEERYAFSCLWEMTSDAKIISTEFCKSIIRSRAALTYIEAQMKIDDVSLNDELTSSLRNLNKLAKILKRRRTEQGALTLASSEVRFNIDSETHDPIDVQNKELKETNSMVEEFMLLANISSAQRILDEFPECALLRRHPNPPFPNFEPLIKAGQSRGFQMEVSTGKLLAESLDRAVDPKNPYFNVMLRMVATRCMTQALYFCSGCLMESEYPHYGLAVPLYTHFTSPIRRYSDVIVHRLLAAAIGSDSTYPTLVDKKHTQTLCNNLNYRHKMGQYAGRASVDLYTHIFYKDRITEEQGFILFVRENALQILLPKVGLETTLYLRPKRGTPGPVVFTYDPQAQSQTAGNFILKQFDPVTVQISLNSSDVQHQKLEVKLVNPFIPEFSVAKSDDINQKCKRLKCK